MRTIEIVTLRLGRFFWKLFVANAVVMALVLLVGMWVITAQFNRFYQAELTDHLTAQAAALEVVVRDHFDPRFAGELEALAKEVTSPRLEGMRVTFVRADGTVLGDSEADPSEMDLHADRPEVRAALAHGFGESMRWSHTVSANLKYVAVRVGPEDAPLGVVRVAMPVKTIGARAEPAQRLILAIALVSVVAAILLALALAFLWSRPIQHVTETARSIARGDLSARVRVRGRDEVTQLGRALNRMQERLSSHVETIDRQRRTLDSLVSQLREGVVVADEGGRIVLINNEAVRMLQPQSDADASSMIGRTVEQCVRQLQLQRMLTVSDRIRSAVAPKDPGSMTEAKLQVDAASGLQTVLARATDIHLPGAATGQRGGDAYHVGRVLVLTDVTDLARVMQVKADLAANASHELRTPLSAIRAAVETLRSIDADGDAQAAARLIDVVDRHSRRMEAMVQELLELSRLESGTATFDIVPVDVAGLIDECAQDMSASIQDKHLRFTKEVDGSGKKCRVNPELLRMVLRNLIDNAVRFTGTGGAVTVSFRYGAAEAVLAVADTGCGIPTQDRSRVFERFYQVERARSGQDRGTGLGLSIVRHAVAAMNGTVDLASEVGVGTTVTVKIPQAS